MKREFYISGESQIIDMRLRSLNQKDLCWLYRGVGWVE